VIDGDSGKGRAACALPVMEEMEERQRIASAGDRHPEPGRRMPCKTGRDTVAEPRIGRCHEQPRRLISVCAEATAAAVG